MTNTKTYWLLVKALCDGKKLPIIPPLLIDSKVTPDSEVKVYYFNNFLLVNLHLWIITVRLLKTKLTQQILNFI